MNFNEKEEGTRAKVLEQFITDAILIKFETQLKQLLCEIFAQNIPFIEKEV